MTDQNSYITIQDYRELKALQRKRYLLEQRIIRLRKQVKRLDRKIEDLVQS